MAMRRWHQTALVDPRSRAPNAGSGVEGGGAAEPDPATGSASEGTVCAAKDRRPAARPASAADVRVQLRLF